MTFCPNCGKPLADGEICACTNNLTNPVVEETQPQVESAVQPEPVQEETPSQPDYIPEQQQQQPEFAQPDYTQAYNPNVPPQNGYYAPPVYYPPTKPAPRTDYPEGYKIKKKYVAVILAASLGVFGIHNFYLGNRSKALTQVLLSTVAGLFTLGISTAVVSIWSLVECVMLLTENEDTDANGFKIQTLEEALNPKKDNE